jgi:hypothetical protein
MLQGPRQEAIPVERAKLSKEATTDHVAVNEDVGTEEIVSHGVAW